MLSVSVLWLIIKKNQTQQKQCYVTYSTNGSCIIRYELRTSLYFPKWLQICKQAQADFASSITGKMVTVHD